MANQQQTGVGAQNQSGNSPSKNKPDTDVEDLGGSSSTSDDEEE